MARRSNHQEPAISERTRRRHRELANAVRDLLQHRYTEPLTLGEISAPLRVSPCFLCRVFRRETGGTIHGYLMNLRLTRAVELLADGQGENLSRLGLDLGFASHSHFTRAFCRRFGAPPSVVRGRLLAQSRVRRQKDQQPIFEQDFASAASLAGSDLQKDRV